MKWIKYFLFSFVAFLASLSISLLIGTSTSAVSEYDNVIQNHTGSITINTGAGGTEYTFANKQDVIEAFKNKSFSYSDYCTQSDYDQILNRINNNYSYSLSYFGQGTSNMGMQLTVAIGSNTANLEGIFTTVSSEKYLYLKEVLRNDQSVYSIVLRSKQGGGLQAGYCGVTTNVIASGVSNGLQFKFVGQSDLFVNYPSGYEGSQPDGMEQKDKLRPNILFDVSDKNVSINSKIDDVVKAQLSDYKVFWFISNTNIDGDGSSCDPVFSTSGYSLPNEPLTFTAPCYGVYSVNAYFAYSNGDYPIDDFDNYQIVETTINVNVNGGYFSIDTSNDFVCDDNNFCQHESALWVDEQCDLLHLGGCVNNIIHYLQVALGIDKTATNPTGSPFISFRTETHGLLAIVTAPLSAINALTTSTCSPVTFTIPFINKNISLPCYYSIYQQNLGNVFIIYQTIATGVIAYFVIVGILRQVKEIKDPKKDQIEVVNL